MSGLQINIQAEGTQGRVDIIGNISEWSDNNAIDFRERCQEIKNAGATNCLLYMMTNGGDCFQAEEIYNILIEIFGEYDAEGGAIVASAGAYLAVRAKSFIPAKNTQLMIHKPSGGVGGTENEIESYLTLLKNMTSNYYEAFKAKLKKPEADFKAKWEAGDIWLTAQEGKEWGFVTSIKEPVKVTQALAESIKASGSPLDFSPEYIISNSNNDKKMNLQAIKLVLGLAASATETEIEARISENAEKARQYDALKASVEAKEKTELSAKVKARLDKAEQEKVITAEERTGWDELLTADFDKHVKLLDMRKPIVALSEEIKPSADGNGSTYNGKTFEQLQETPTVLEALQKEKPQVYDSLFADWKKRNGLK